MPPKKSNERASLPRSAPTPVDDLNLDPSNPRILERSVGEDQEEILRLLWREMAVEEIVISIAENGFFEHEPLLVTKESGKLIVIEGNRRLAAVKLLLSPALARKLGISGVPSISKQLHGNLSKLPVIICSRDAVWNYIGFKHVHGPQPWESYSKAQYIARVHNEQSISLDDIAKKIGDRHATVKRLYRALMVIEQAEHEKLFDRQDRYQKKFAFSHLYTGLDKPGIPDFIGIRDDSGYKENPVPKKHFKNLEDLLQWIYGSKKEDKKPVIKSQNPDLKIFDEVLRSPNGVAALRKGLPLQVSHEISKGDEQLLREALVSSKHELEQVIRKVPTGFNNEEDLLELASDIEKLAKSIHSEMKKMTTKENQA